MQIKFASYQEVFLNKLYLYQEPDDDEDEDDENAPAKKPKRIELSDDQLRRAIVDDSTETEPIALPTRITRLFKPFVRDYVESLRRLQRF